MGVAGRFKKTTEQYKLELENVNLINKTNIKLKEGVEYIDTKTKILHICTCGKEWFVNPTNILSRNSKKCGLCLTFAEKGINDLGDDFLEEYWDYKTNNELGIDPWKISYGAEIDVYIFCKKVDYHGSYKVRCADFSKGSRCGYCQGYYLVHPLDSYGQFLIDSFGITALELYWDYDENTVDPFKITKQSNKKVYIKCQAKEYHGSYGVRCGDFVKGDRCGYCGGKKVHPLDSLGALYQKVLGTWSDINKKSPYEYMPGSDEEVWFKCGNEKHEDYQKRIYNAVNCNFKCPTCSQEQKESVMASTLKQVLRWEYSHTEWEFDAGFKIHNNISRYDIYVPELNNLLIECQSEYHDNDKRIKVDQLKKEFAINNGYEYIAIDKRDFTIIEILRFFIPHIDKIPDYVQIDKNTTRNWDIEKAQKLLDSGHTYADIANILETSVTSIRASVGGNGLIKPNNYQVQGANIVCLSIDNNLIKTYNSCSSAAKDLGKANGTSISSCLTKKPRSDTGKIRETAFGFKWMYLVDYENMIKDQNNKPP